MITILDHEQELTAEKIYKIFQVSYAVEAELLGALDFPPLKRTVANFLKSDTSFFGFWQGENLTSVIEIDALPKTFHINSLVVDPYYFRQGIASKLMEHILDLFEGNTITVETGLANEPAKNLYKRFGFKEVKQYDTDHGIRKIRLELEKPNL
jgi:ribosomal protein S18 acetylase RimI-like enzyme